MKNIMIKIAILFYFCLAPLAMNQAMADANGKYYYRLNTGKKEALNVVTNPLPAGRRVSWGNCSGETTTELNQQGQACEIVSNDLGGYTGTTEVCASPVGAPLLNNSACYQDCNAGTLEWSSGQCKADVITSVHNESKTIANITTQYTGSGTFICEDGTWQEQTNTCTENDSVCGTDNNQTLGSIPTNLCSFGTASTVSQTSDTYSWTCTNVLKTTSCSAIKAPVCDNSTYQGCSIGTESAYTSAIGASTVTWNCSSGTQTIACSKQAVIGTSAVCGSSNGQTFASAPSSGLCSTGTQSSVTNNTSTYTWSCYGTVATQVATKGADVNCSANKENWVATTPTCEASYDKGSESCGSYSPAATTQTSTFTQIANCSIGRAQMCQAREYETYTENYRNVGNKYEQIVSDRSYTKNRNVTVSWSGWVTNNSNCTTYTPLTSSYPSGQSFTQSRNCSYEQTQTRSYSSGESFVENRTLTNQTETRGATGTQSASCGTSFATCNVGNASSYTSGIGASTVTWNCTNGDSIISCNKNATSGGSGSCGSANGSISGSTPTALCSSGYGVSSVSTSAGWYTWTCYGQSATQTSTTGSPAACASTMQAVCNNNSFQSCNFGIPSNYTSSAGAGTVTWNCTNGISTASCNKSATTGASGVCGSANGTISGSTPTALCSSGYGATGVSLGAGWYSWSCYGQPSTQTSITGSTTSCGATKQATCNNASFQDCGFGIASGFTSSIGSSTATWNCENGSSVASCNKAKSSGSNGVCGSANGGTFASAPSSGLCSSGTPSGVSGSSTYSWTCSGSAATHTNLAGSPTSCSASGANWVATSASCGSNYDSGAGSCGSWTPSVSTQSSSFSQSQSCSVPQARSCQPREYDTVSGTYRNVGSTYTENVGDRTYNNPRTVTVSDSGWVNSGGMYNCSGYTPDPSTINSGQAFTQNGYCKQNQIATYTYSVGGSYQYNSRTIDVAHSRGATGTKALLASCSNSSAGSLIKGKALDSAYDEYDFYDGQDEQQLSINSSSCSGYATSGTTAHGGSQSGGCSWSGIIRYYQYGYYQGSNPISGNNSGSVTCNNGSWE